MIEDFTASSGTSEISVVKGQQVEVIDFTEEWATVKIFHPVKNVTQVEGVIPCSILKPPPVRWKPESQGKSASFYYSSGFFSTAEVGCLIPSNEIFDSKKSPRIFAQYNNYKCSFKISCRDS